MVWADSDSPGVFSWLDCCLARESFQDPLVGNFGVRVAGLLLSRVAGGEVPLRLRFFQPLPENVGFVLELVLHSLQVLNSGRFLAQLLHERLRFLALLDEGVSRQWLRQVLLHLLQLRSELRHSFRLEAGPCRAFLGSSSIRIS